MSSGATQQTSGAQAEKAQQKVPIVVDIISDPNWYWAWPSKRRVQAVIPQFEDQAEFEIRFQPFQLYPDLPKGDNQGVDKIDYFQRLRTARNGGVPPDPAISEERGRQLRAAWKEDGLTLAPKGGRWGQSFDAQRLISLARKQGREDAMVEEIYSGNHEQNHPLSDHAFLLAAAERAGVTGAAELLQSDQEAAEVRAKVRKHIEMGINAVPVIVVNDQKPIHGAPDHAKLVQAFREEIRKGKGAEN